MAYKKLIAIVVLLLIPMLLNHLALAGTTGKISGRVVEKESGDPLPGANILIPGTTMGAASDLDGYFVILGIPPGTYDVQVSMMGYGKVTVNDVRVRIDQTSTVNFELSAEAIAGQEVTVIAQKNEIKQDVATSVVAISANEVRELPYNTIEELATLQAGVEEDLTIRGSAADQSLFQVDGITLRDPRNNRPITGIALSAVKEISLERGGFTAEYGQLQAGLINIVTKEGSKDHYEGSIILKYSPPQEKHFGISPFDANSMWLRPYLDDDVAWTGTQNGAWDEYTQRQYDEFEGWNAISQRLLTDDDPSNDLSPQAAQRLFKWHHRKQVPTDQPDYNIDAGFGGPVPFVSEALGDLRFFSSFRREREMLLVPLSRDDYVDYNWSLQLTSDITQSMKLKLNGMLGRSYNVAANDFPDWQYFDPENPDAFGINPGANTNYFQPTHYIRTPHRVAQTTYEQRPGRIFSDAWYSQAVVDHRIIGAQLTHLLGSKTYYDARIEYVGRDYETGPIETRDDALIQEIIPGYFVDEAPFGYSSDPVTSLDGMFMGGHMATTRDSTTTSSLRLRFDLTSQLNNHNLFKTGVEVERFDINLNYANVKPFVGIRTVFKQDQNPYRVGLYVQNKLETNGFILNAGLRLDYSDANTQWVNVDPFSVEYFSNSFSEDADIEMQDAKAQLTLSPRLSVSHPITDNSKLFFNYGHFNQLPTYEQIFTLSRDLVGAATNIGDPNLNLARTISYELGYDHVIANNYLLQLAGFYRDIIDQTDFTTYQNARGNVSYTLITNDGYEDIRGLEVTLRKNQGRWWRGFANYTYQVSTEGRFGRFNVFEDPSAQRVEDRQTANLYQQRPDPTPYARVSLFLNMPDDFGPDFLGGKVFGGWELNFLMDWESGGSYTWNPNNVSGIQQNLDLTDFFNTTLRFTKTFSFNAMDLTFFADIQNVFNTRKLSGASFWDAFDHQYYMDSLHLPESDAYDNIPGDDKVGDYREPGVDFQPIEQIGLVTDLADPNPDVIYYERTSGSYMNFVDGAWSEVPGGRMDQILEDKAYIDMPNQTSFNFLNPRQIFFGLRTSFNF